MANTERLGIKLPEDLKERMKEYSDEIGITMSAVAILSLRAYFDAQDTMKAIARQERERKLHADSGNK